MPCDATECDSACDAGTREQYGGLAHHLPPSHQTPVTPLLALDDDNDQSVTINDNNKKKKKSYDVVQS